MKKIDILKRIQVFSTLSDAELENVSAAGKIVRFKNRNLIIAENSPGKDVFFIIRGQVLIYRIGEEDGKLKTLAILSDGDVFGEMSILSPAARCASALSLGNVKVLKLNAAAFRSTMTENQGISFALLDTLCRRLRKADRHIEILSYQNVPTKTIQMLLTLANNRSKSAVGASILITQRELAEMISSAREVVNRTLQVIKEKGLIELCKGRINIPNIKKLKKYRPNGG